MRWQQPRTRVGVYNALIFGGSILGAAFPPSEFWFLSLIGFLPLLWAMSAARRWQEVVRWSYIAFFFYHGVANWWIGSWQVEADPFLRLSGIVVWIVHPLFFTLPWLGWWIVRRTFGESIALWSLPWLWVAFEWLHSLGDLAYPWLSIGYMWLPWHTAAQVADVGGVWILSWFLLQLNVLLWLAARQMLQRRWKFAALYTGSAMLLLGFAWLYGHWRLQQLERHKAAKAVTVAIVQPNINPWKKWEQLLPWQNIHLHLQLLQQLDTGLQRVDVAIWSETAIPFWITWDRYRAEFARLRRWIDSTGIAVLSGFPDLVFYDAPPTPSAKPLKNTQQWYQTFNAALLLQPHQEVYQTYHKIHLTPFAEHVPYAEAFSFLQDWIQWGVGISSWGKGERQRVFQLQLRSGEQIRMGPVICIESIFPDFVANLVRRGADAIVIITNDGWFQRTPGPQQHFEIARMRAIETRRTVLRCANTGISGIIAPDGNVLAVMPEATAGVLKRRVALPTVSSFYVRWGDWFPQLSSVVAGGFLLFALLRQRQQLPIRK